MMKDGTVQQKHETHHQHQDDEISSSSGTFSTTTTTTTTTTPSSSIDEDDTNMMASLRDAILDVCDDDTKDLRCESRHNKTHVITNKGSFSSSASTSSGESSSLSSSSSEMMMMMQQLFSQTHQGSSAVDASAASSTTGPDESQWRKHGLKHRLKLLDEDRLKGGHDFKIAPQDCSVHRYFQVAHFVS
jgi:hypothetical protein